MDESSQDTGKGMLQKTIGNHPTAVAGAIGVMIVVVIILSYFVVHYKSKSSAASVAAKEGLEAGVALANNANAAAAAASAQGSATVFPQVGPASPCARGWDPAASAEAQALATTGALQHDSYGEGNLQGAIDGAYDSGAGLSDDQLATLVQNGDAM
jgi:hypothetical protein